MSSPPLPMYTTLPAYKADLARLQCQSYKNVLIFFISLKAFYLLLGLFYIYFDRYHLNGILTRSEGAKVARDAKLASGEKMEKRARYRDALPGWTFLGIGVGLVLVVVAWVVYLVYSQGS